MKGLHVFLCKPSAPLFEVKQRWAPFLPGFSGLLPRISANPNGCRCACNLCTPISNTTAFHNSIIGDFMVDQDQLETNLLQLFRHPENCPQLFYCPPLAYRCSGVPEYGSVQLRHSATKLQKAKPLLFGTIRCKGSCCERPML